MADAKMRAEAHELWRASMDLEEKLDALLRGRRVRILSSFNGQPYGTSRTPLTGKVRTVRSAFFDGVYGPCLFLDGENLSIPLSEVEIL